MTELYARSWALDDIEILRGADGYGDGRTVRAYAAAFDVDAEIHDQHGHYIENIDRRAFNRQIGLGIDRVSVFYNHAMTVHGTPASGLGAVPCGVPLDVKPDGRGLITVTRYNQGEFADGILEAIRNNALRGYSFRGRIYKSNPERPPRKTRDGALPRIVRMELGLTEYGPTPSPAYAEAGILAIRAALEHSGLTAEEALRMLASTTPPDRPVEDEETLSATSASEPGDARDQPDAQRAEHLRVQQLKLRLRMRLRDKGL